jgi:hypothetical protein
MSRRTLISSLFVLLLAVPAIAGNIVSEDQLPRRYRVTVTNLTPGQGFSPAVIVAHTSAFDLFEVTEAASPGVARVAEEGDPTIAVAEATAAAGVHDVVVAGTGPFMPGQSVSAEVEATSASVLSVIGMLGSTNDAFYGLDSHKLTFGTPMTIYVPAYDAGSERNTEDCDHVPGPPCNAMGVRVTAGAEGFITVHNGIHGFADLPPITHDWNNPVARITIERVFP